MNCREFEEIADSYLSGELLVETNHELLRHLEACADCRTDLAERRELRSRLQTAVKQSAVIDPAFAARLRSEIREQAGSSVRWSFVPALGFAGVVIAALIGSAVYFQSGIFGPTQPARAGLEEILRQNGLMAALHDALGNHKYCGVKFGKDPAVQVVNDNEYAALKENFSGNLEFVEKHNCLFNGKKYSHTILRDGDKLISILKTDSALPDDPNKIVSLPVEQLQIAEFESDKRSVFVISDLSETENLQIARVISKNRSV
ncbi:MAG: hypothetical protein HOP17_00870 [Acidobacteria bacterium]|nr:hypothetical protein [Acidobacteriota bacterium]